MLSISAGLVILLSALGVQSTDNDALTAPPILRKAPAQTCTCPQTRESGIIILEGLIVDGEVTLGPDQLSINDRQAAIIDVARTRTGDENANFEDEIRGRTRIWHNTRPSQCGVTFDYGRTYKIAVRKTEDGEFETDQCLMRRASSAQ